MAREVIVFEVLYSVGDDHPQAHGGAAGDGSFIFRSRSRREAEAFAREHAHPYGGPCEAREARVPARLADRWGV